MRQIDHIGIAVKDIDRSKVLFTSFFGEAPFHEEIVESQHLKVSFYQIGTTKIELLFPLNEKSTVHKFLEKKGEGIHHTAFLVKDIQEEIERLKSEGFKMIGEKPMIGALGKLVCFFHPKTTNGVLIELCQKID